MRPLATIKQHDLNHPGQDWVEVEARITCDRETAKRLVLELALELNLEEIPYVSDKIYHENAPVRG